uniref:Uncharacterized protein n=1 Tax=uncultured bacterium esnapd15 TaxID=1366595 RepID=S5TLE7_9BACT|nr:hypothetical protein [uncultured bacterium esnapd15]
MRIAYRALLHKLLTLRLSVPFDEIPFRHDMGVYGCTGFR